MIGRLHIGVVCLLCFGVPASSGWEASLDPSLVAIPDRLEPPALSGTREDRFPSKEERLALYMSNWYVPPCDDYREGLVRYDYSSTSTQDDSWPTLTVQVAPDFSDNTTRMEVQSAIEPDTAFFIDPGTVLDCLKPDGHGDPHYQDRIKFRKNMIMYCQDVASTVLTAVSHVDWEQEHDSTTTPTLIQFGDLKHSHIFGSVNVPLFKKFRSATMTQNLQNVVSKDCYSEPRPVLQTVHNTTNFQPIVWKLASHRHYGNLEKVYREDTPWQNKIDMAVFRGQLTGSRGAFNKHLPPQVNCMNMRRCRLVYMHANSTLVHARLTSTRNRLPEILNGVPLMGPSVTIRRLLAYKGIIMLEGNDVASGLKWALLSQSVVLMPIPHHTSWAMEELLEPWVHYIPLNENATDVEAKMQWVLDNDEAARRISERASLWMEDLVFHPDAAQDDRWIQEEMIRRYRRHFVRGLSS